jgi:hypothetical protein
MQHFKEFSRITRGLLGRDKKRIICSSRRCSDERAAILEAPFRF